jgi:hypothetical protein
MADLAFLPPEPSLPRIRGGPTRASTRIDLAAYPEIARRRALDAALTVGTCPFGGDPPRFGADDVDLLVRITAERFGGDGVLLRHQAIRALGALGVAEGHDRLVALARRVVEHDSIRTAALVALPERIRIELGHDLVEDPTPSIAEYARRTIEGRGVERRPTPAQAPGDPDRRQCCTCDTP